MPSTTPIAACSGDTADWKAASRKTDVSKPSRMTARKAMTISAPAEPRANALPAAPCRLLRRSRECLRIHRIM